MDVTEKVDLIKSSPTEEIVTEEELIELFKTNSNPKHYIGIEISGFLHLGSLLTTGYKINDFIEAEVDCTVFLADWHTIINEKLGGNEENISKVSKYYKEAFETVCPRVHVKMGSELYAEEQSKGYWKDLIRFTKHMSLARTMRTLTIMGRSEKEEKIDLAKLLYPPMQALDIRYLDVDIVHAGMDQRKIHMLVRDTFPKMGKDWKVPVAVHHKLLPGLTKPGEQEATYLGLEGGGNLSLEGGGKLVLNKMSKTNPNSTIFIHDSDDEIKSKIKKAWCEEGNIENNPLLEITEQILFHEYDEIPVERPEKFGGNVSYSEYTQLELDFKNRNLHPNDLKQTVARLLTPKVSEIRGKLALEHDIFEIIKNSV
ncbi:MAG: Tyrosyl-tRNA synthetase [Nitrosopumilales archaeon]|nr:MAG: Tyrosyl-tRNA synthetase [Nitrosopumilales archaeon]